MEDGLFPHRPRGGKHTLVQLSIRVTNCTLILFPSTACTSVSACPASMPYSSRSTPRFCFGNQSLPILSPCDSSEMDHTSLLAQGTLAVTGSGIGMRPSQCSESQSWGDWLEVWKNRLSKGCLLVGCKRELCSVPTWEEYK